MNKKILLASILVFAVFNSYSTVALSDEVVSSDTVLKYTPITNGVYSFGVDGKTYGTLVELGQFIYPRFKAGEGFSFDENSEKLVEADILTGQLALLGDLTRGLSMLTGESFTMQEAQLVIGILNLAKANGFEPFQEISFNNFFKAENAGRLGIRKLVKIFRGLSGIIDGLKALGDENAAIIGKLAVSDPNIKALVIQKTVLAQQPSTKVTTAQLQVVNRQILEAFLETPEGVKVRNSPNNQENLKNGLQTLEDLLGLFNKKTDNIQAAADALTLYLADPAKTQIKDLPEVQKPDTHTTSSLLNSTLTTAGILNNRIGVVNNYGVASGDEVETYGVWAKGSFSSGEQKPFKAEPGYKFNQKGVMVGVDTGDDVDGESMIGMAGSFFRNDVTNKTSSSARDKLDTYMGSFYGLFSVNSKIFFSGQASYGYSNIKKRRATGDLANNIATAKTTATTLVARVRGGYVYVLSDDTQIVSFLGIGQTNVKVKGYSENGLGLNRTVGKRKLTRTYGLVGISGRYMTQIGGIKIRPELHANMDYAFNSKNSATQINLAGVIDSVIPAEKQSRSFYNIGGSVKFVVSNMIDITTGYDLGLSTKFISHTGALKLRVNF